MKEQCFGLTGVEESAAAPMEVETAEGATASAGKKVRTDSASTITFVFVYLKKKEKKRFLFVCVCLYKLVIFISEQIIGDGNITITNQSIFYCKYNAWKGISFF